MTQPSLELEQVEVTYGAVRALAVQELSVEAGETLVVMGLNGSGKSTLIRVMALLERPTRGVVRFHGQEVAYRQSMPIRRRMAVVLQNALLRDASVYENVATGLRIRSVSDSEVKRRVGAWLERLGIEHLRNRRAKQLSGGESQRVSLARALVLEPEVLFLDEPFSSLDAPSRTVFLEDIRSLLKETPVTVVMATHDRGEALVLGDRVGVLVNGGLRQMGTPSQVFHSPVDEDVAAFVGMDNVFRGQVLAREGNVLNLQVGKHMLRLLEKRSVDNQAVVGIRPEDVSIRGVNGHAYVEERDLICNRITGRVLAIAPLGLHVRVRVDCGFEVVAVVSREVYLELGLTRGREVEVVFSGEKAQILPFVW